MQVPFKDDKEVDRAITELMIWFTKDQNFLKESCSIRKLEICFRKYSFIVTYYYIQT